MSMIRHTLIAGAVALTLAAAAPGAAAQGYPAKSITLVVPAAAGGPTDTVSRLVAESMSRTLGQTVVVENVGGAGGTIGMARVAKAAPDGYTHRGLAHRAGHRARALRQSQIRRGERFRPSSAASPTCR